MCRAVELLKFVSDYVYVDMRYNDISLTFIAGYVSLWYVCSLGGGGIFGLSGSLLGVIWKHHNLH